MLTRPERHTTTQIPTTSGGLVAVVDLVVHTVRPGR